jgi:hypothetical protein
VINPKGHCHYLPFYSDIVQHPERHPRWTILSTPCPPKPVVCSGDHWFAWFFWVSRDGRCQPRHAGDD